MRVATPTRIFVSYAHEDKAWRDVLFSGGLSTPEGYLCPWTDAMLVPGMSWNDAILAELEQATIAILLVSRYFLSSDYISRIELPSVLKRRASQGLKLLWIPVGSLDGVAVGELAAIEAAWSPDEPLAAVPVGGPVANEKIAKQVRENLEAAIDPVGVPLMRELQNRFDPFVRMGVTDSSALYKTRDRHLNRSVVIKTLTDERSRDAFVKNVCDAAVVADEPNFAAIYEAVLSDRRRYCVMQYIEGQNLRRWIEADRRRPLDVIIRILAKIARALVGVHALGCNYGNLKPSNVILTRKNEPYILPMGRRVDECRGEVALEGLERRAPDIEEIAYLAPEQFDTELETVSGELTDQYMLGLLAYELVTGALPPTIDGAAPTADSLACIRSRGSEAFSTLPPVTDLRPDCPDVLARIIQRMTSKAPDDRYPSLAELLIDVRRQEDMILSRVRESYKRCLENRSSGGVGFIEAMYAAFFALRPDARALFANLGARQYEIFEKAVVDLFAFYDRERANEPNEPNVLTQVAQKHDRRNYNVALDFYGPFRDALIDTACGPPDHSELAYDPKCRGDAGAQKRMRRAWDDVLRPGVAYMQHRY